MYVSATGGVVVAERVGELDLKVGEMRRHAGVVLKLGQHKAVRCADRGCACAAGQGSQHNIRARSPRVQLNTGGACVPIATWVGLGEPVACS